MYSISQLIFVFLFMGSLKFGNRLYLVSDPGPVTLLIL